MLHVPIERCWTCPFFAPLLGVPNDVVSLFVQATQLPRLHDIILGEPDLEFLMPPPVPVVSLSSQLAQSHSELLSDRYYLQLLRSLLLRHVAWATVENPHQGLLVEATDLCLQGLHIVDFVALRQAVVRNWWPWRSVVP